MTEVNTAPSFRQGVGAVITSFGGSEESASDVAIQADGKILLGGAGAANGDYNDFGLVRYNADGTLDKNFGKNGKVVTPVGWDDTVGKSVAVQADGKIVLAGNAYHSSTYQYHSALVRYNADGSLDESFGKAGKVITSFDHEGDSLGESVAIQADGKIVVGGYADSESSSGSDFALARYNVDGSLDKSFSKDGKVVTSVGDYIFPGTDEIQSIGESVIIEPNGKIVLGGYSSNGYNKFLFVRYNADGTVDEDSGIGGTSVGLADAEGYSVALQSDGKIVMGGKSWTPEDGDCFTLVRFNADGAVDVGFGKDGRVVTPLGKDHGFDSQDVQSIAIQSDGKIVMGGTSYGDETSDFALVRYNPDGSLDKNFGEGGKVISAVGGDDEGISVTLQPDGKIILAGASYDDSGSSHGGNFTLVRYNADGSLDKHFGNADTLGGTVSFTRGGPAVVIDPDVTIFDTELRKLGNYEGAKLTLMRSGGARGEDAFGLDHSGRVFSLGEGDSLIVRAPGFGLLTEIGKVSQNSDGKLALSFNKNATDVLVNETLQSITYSNTSKDPLASIKLKWLFSDGNHGKQGAGGAASASGTTTVLIKDGNGGPKIASNGGKVSASLSTIENKTAVMDFKASHIDGDKIVWSLAGGADAKLFAIDAKSGALSFKNAPDFETPRDAGKNNSYDVVVKASSGKYMDSQALSVHVANVKGITKNGTSKTNTLTGTGEEDTLDGKAGKDTLTGGKGHDTFVFSTALGLQNIDTITDFSHPDDRLMLSSGVFKGVAKGALDEGAFHLGTKAADSQDRILYDRKHGDLFFDRDGAKDHYDPIWFAHLSEIHGARPSLDHSDFFVM